MKAGSITRTCRKFANGWRATDALRRAPEIELFDLRHGKRLALATLAANEIPTVDPWLLSIIDDAIAVSDHYGISLKLPEVVTQEDANTLHLLTNLIHGSESPITTMRFGLRKLTETTPEMLRSIHANSSFTVNSCAMSPPPQLFGVPVETGVITWHFERARLKNRDQFAMRLKRAEIGDSIDAILQVNGPVRVFALGKSLVINP